MNVREVAGLVTYIAIGDNRHIDEGVIAFWLEAVGDLDYQECRAAVLEHRKTSAAWLQPSHVRDGVKRVRAERAAQQQHPAIETGPAAFQRSEDEAAAVKRNTDRLRAELAPVLKKWAMPMDIKALKGDEERKK